MRGRGWKHAAVREVQRTAKNDVAMRGKNLGSRCSVTLAQAEAYATEAYPLRQLFQGVIGTEMWYFFLSSSDPPRSSRSPSEARNEQEDAYHCRRYCRRTAPRNPHSSVVDRREPVQTGDPIEAWHRAGAQRADRQYKTIHFFRRRRGGRRCHFRRSSLQQLAVSGCERTDRWRSSDSADLFETA